MFIPASMAFQLAIICLLQLLFSSAANFRTELNSHSNTVNCCLLSPVQSFFFWGHTGFHVHIFVLSRLLQILKWSILFDERRSLAAAGHNPSKGM
jgi:hypothetical protein